MSWLIEYFNPDNPYFLCGVVIASVSFLFESLFFYLHYLFYSRRCEFDCSKCFVWDCQFHECARRREKYYKKLEEEKEN